MIMMANETTDDSKKIRIDDTTVVKSQSSQKSQRENQGLFLNNSYTVTLSKKQLKKMYKFCQENHLKEVKIGINIPISDILSRKVIALDEQKKD